MTEKRLTVTVNEAAALLGISRPTVYMLMRQGRLTQLKMGSRTLISRSQVVALVEGTPGGQDAPKPLAHYTAYKLGRKRSGAQ